MNILIILLVLLCYKLTVIYCLNKKFEARKSFVLCFLITTIGYLLFTFVIFFENMNNSGGITIGKIAIWLGIGIVLGLSLGSNVTQVHQTMIFKNLKNMMAGFLILSLEDDKSIKDPRWG